MVNTTGSHFWHQHAGLNSSAILQVDLSTLSTAIGANQDAGWVTIIGWQAGQASVSFLAASLIQGLAILNYPNYHAERWHCTLIFYAVIAYVVFINTYLARWLPKIEGMILILHIVGFFAILIPLVYLAPHGTASDVFATFLNHGEWKTGGLAFFVGLITSVFSFLGNTWSKRSLSFC